MRRKCWSYVRPAPWEASPDRSKVPIGRVRRKHGERVRIAPGMCRLVAQPLGKHLVAKNN